MSSWNEIKNNIQVIAKKTAKKTEELADTAVFKVKIGAKQNELNTQFKNLGIVTYKKLHSESEDDTAALTEKIAVYVSNIDKLSAELRALKEEYKKHIESTKPKKKVSVSIGNGKVEPDDELLKAFNEARDAGNEDFAEASALADSAAEESAVAQELANDAQKIAESL